MNVTTAANAFCIQLLDGLPSVTWAKHWAINAVKEKQHKLLHEKSTNFYIFLKMYIMPQTLYPVPLWMNTQWHSCKFSVEDSNNLTTQMNTLKKFSHSTFPPKKNNSYVFKCVRVPFTDFFFLKNM